MRIPRRRHRWFGWDEAGERPRPRFQNPVPVWRGCGPRAFRSRKSHCPSGIAVSHPRWHRPRRRWVCPPDTPPEPTQPESPGFSAASVSSGRGDGDVSCDGAEEKATLPTQLPRQEIPKQEQARRKPGVPTTRARTAPREQKHIGSLWPARILSFSRAHPSGLPARSRRGTEKRKSRAVAWDEAPAMQHRHPRRGCAALPGIRAPTRSVRGSFRR